MDKKIEDFYIKPDAPRKNTDSSFFSNTLVTGPANFSKRFVDLLEEGLNYLGITFSASSGNVAVSGDLEVAGDTTVDGTLEVGTGAEITGDSEITGTLTVTKPILTAALTLGATSTNTGAAVSNNTLFVGTEDGLVYWKDNTGTVNAISFV